MKDSWDKVFRSLLWELQVPRDRWNAKMRGSLFHIALFFYGKEGRLHRHVRSEAVSHFFSDRFGSQPPPLWGTSFRGKEGDCGFPIAKPPSRTLSFRAKARNLFRSRSGEAVRRGRMGNTALPATWKYGVSCRKLYEGKRKRGTKKIPRLRSG